MACCFVLEIRPLLPFMHGQIRFKFHRYIVYFEAVWNILYVAKYKERTDSAELKRQEF